MKTVQDYLEYPVSDWREHQRQNIECRKRKEAEKSVCKWCRSHATSVSPRGHVVWYACGVSRDKHLNRWSSLNTSCETFRMRNRIKQLEKEVKRLRRLVQKSKSPSVPFFKGPHARFWEEMHGKNRKFWSEAMARIKQPTKPEVEKLVDTIFKPLE